jgi:hypothetical protein
MPTPFPFLRTVRFINKDVVSGLLDVMDPLLFGEMAEKAIATGHPGPIMKAISGGYIPEGYGHFFVDAIPIPPLVSPSVCASDAGVDGAVYGISDEGARHIAEVSQGLPEVRDALVVERAFTDNAGVPRPLGATEVYGALPTPVETDSVYLYSPGQPSYTTAHLPPALPRGGHDRCVPSFRLRDLPGRPWVGYVGGPYAILGRHPSVVAHAVNSAWSRGGRGMPDGVVPCRVSGPDPGGTGVWGPFLYRCSWEGFPFTTAPSFGADEEPPGLSQLVLRSLERCAPVGDDDLRPLSPSWTSFERPFGAAR